MTTKLTIEGYVIASADGMLTDATHQQPDALRFKADHRFFIEGLNRAALVVHGRNSGDGDPRKRIRRRLIVTRQIAAVAPADDIPKSFYWNPAGALFEEACAAAGVYEGTVAIIGGPDIFAMFFDRYDVFWLSQAPHVQLPGGQGCFAGVPAQTPQQLLAEHGLSPGAPRILDAAHDVTVTPWRRG